MTIAINIKQGNRPREPRQREVQRPRENQQPNQNINTFFDFTINATPLILIVGNAIFSTLNYEHSKNRISTKQYINKNNELILLKRTLILILLAKVLHNAYQTRNNPNNRPHHT